MKRFLLLSCIAAGLLAGAGCVQVAVKPIHITVDVNVKVDKALDDFFGELDSKSATIERSSHTSQP
ncbi:hypothetical protein K0B96_03100 [Horticoccus luteus]|uniref:YnbE-like lipoprotein n=1 Tax=Horticoccus luteus TaxID=2862869 RepID=A0A8F9TV08_9BACT|nr:hypothetical protein [Horticoccus luteus]QYM79621.1 hypothetical protein K0B96_03100 [Horticoccus luteus]